MLFYVVFCGFRAEYTFGFRLVLKRTPKGSDTCRGTDVCFGTDLVFCP